MPFQTVNGSVPAVCSIRVHPSDQRTFPLLPNLKDRNRRSRLRCIGMMTRRTIIMSRTMIRMMNRVTEVKRGRVWVGQVARPNGSGRWDIRSHDHPPPIHLQIARLVCWWTSGGPCIVIYPRGPRPTDHLPTGFNSPPFFLSPFISMYLPYTCSTFLSLFR